MDKDLASIQEARKLAEAAYEAQKIWAKATQEQVDRVCAAMADAAYQASGRLGRMASEETGYGVPAHKKLKNEFGSRMVWESIKDVKTVGVIGHDPSRRIYEIAWPMGVVAALAALGVAAALALLELDPREDDWDRLSVVVRSGYTAGAESERTARLVDDSLRSVTLADDLRYQAHRLSAARPGGCFAPHWLTRTQSR